MKSESVIVWFRLDLRLADNPALTEAIKTGNAIVPVFIWTPEEETPWEPGVASRWWTHQSLASLDAGLREKGSRLILRHGPTLETLCLLAKETGAKAVFWNRRYEPVVMARDQRIKESLRAKGLRAESFNGALLHEPWTIQNQNGKPFQVFKPFWKHCLAKSEPQDPLAAPETIMSPPASCRSVPLDEFGLEPRIWWAEGMRCTWEPGERSAHIRLKRFLKGAFGKYSKDRNRPDLVGTSRLSPHLHFGEITPRQIWHLVRKSVTRAGTSEVNAFGNSVFDRTVGQIEELNPVWRYSQFLTEIGWREFAHHLLYHFPHTPKEPLRVTFKKFPWRKNAEFRRAWEKGMTGYPIVDAGMRELSATGWMHNRVRMIVASFLVKHLLQPWQEGARWFWDTLVDADLAQNTLGWQWTTGCGADAAPYFRIFNPVTQGEKFDPNGAYVREWCPELAKLPDRWIHQPDKAPAEILRAAGVRHYPRPTNNHTVAREIALESFASIKAR